MIKQQYAKAAYEISRPLFLFVGGLIFILVIRKIWKKDLSKEIVDMFYSTELNMLTALK